MGGHIEKHRVLSSPPLSASEMVPFRGFYYNGELCRMTKLLFEDGKRYVVYVTASEEEKKASFINFQEQAHLYSLSNLQLNYEWDVFE